MNKKISNVHQVIILKFFYYGCYFPRNDHGLKYGTWAKTNRYRNQELLVKLHVSSKFDPKHVALQPEPAVGWTVSNQPCFQACPMGIWTGDLAHSLLVYVTETRWYLHHDFVKLCLDSNSKTADQQKKTRAVLVVTYETCLLAVMGSLCAWS